MSVLGKLAAFSAATLLISAGSTMPRAFEPASVRVTPHQMSAPQRPGLSTRFGIADPHDPPAARTQA